MRTFLLDIGKAILKLALGFGGLAVLARFVGLVNWFFFQPNEHYVEYRALLAVEEALAAQDTTDVLVLGSSAAIYTIDPLLLESRLQQRLLKVATGGQTIELSLLLARYLAPRLHARLVVLDAYPRLGEAYLSEGVERMVLNTPSAGSSLGSKLMAADVTNPTTGFLWAARAIGTAIKPYGAADTMEQVGMRFGEGFAVKVDAPPAAPGDHYITHLPAEILTQIDATAEELAGLGCTLVVIIPPIQHAEIQLQGPLSSPIIRPSYPGDSCFWDAIHLRSGCSGPYTLEIATLLQPYLPH